MREKKIKINLRVLLASFALVILLAPSGLAIASTISDLQAQLNAKNAQAAAAAAAAAKKQQQAAQIADQISTLTGQISEAEAAVSKTSNQISDTQAALDNLSAQIEITQGSLAAEQDKLGKLASSWYMEGESGLLEAVIGSNSISEVIDQQQYYESVKQQLQSEIERINAIETDLSNQKTDQENKLASLNSLKSDQASQQQYLEKSKTQKNQLLGSTVSAAAALAAQSAEAQAAAAKITAQIQAAYRAQGGGNGKYSSAAIQHSSGGGIQLSVPAYSQNDQRWADLSLGFSGVSIGDAGCLITSMAMVASYFGPTRTPKDIDNSSSFDNNGNFQFYKIDLGELNGYEHKKGYVNLDYIDDQLRAHHPVIVRPMYDPQHWIVVTGGDKNNGYSWNDPYALWSTPKNYTKFYDMRTYD